MADDRLEEESLPRPARPRKLAAVAVGLTFVGIVFGGGALLRSAFYDDETPTADSGGLATPTADPPPTIGSAGDRAAYFAPPPPPPPPPVPEALPDVVEPPPAFVRPSAWDAPISLIPVGGARRAGGGQPPSPFSLANTAASPLFAPQPATPVATGLAPPPAAAPLSSALLPMPAAVEMLADAGTRPPFLPVADRSTEAPALSPFAAGDAAGNAAALYGQKAGLVQATMAGNRNASRLHIPSSRLSLSPGTIVHAVLATGVNTDLPGQFNARVTRTVYDEIDGGIALIPQGSLITGVVSSQVQYGEQRAFLVAQYLRLAGTNHWLDLGGNSASALDGTAGVPADVNNHYGRAVVVGILTAILGTGSAVTRAGLDDDQDSVQSESIASGTNELQRVGGQFLQRELRLNPTLTARPGDELSFILNRELQFEGGGQ